MTNIRMKAVDTLHISGVGPDNLTAGDEFEVPTSIADDLEKRGLATRIGEAKAAPVHANKAEPAPENKVVSAKRKAAK